MVAVALVSMAGVLLAPSQSLAKKSAAEDEAANNWSIRLDVDESYTDNVKWSGDNAVNPDGSKAKEDDYFTTIGTKMELRDIDKRYFPAQVAAIVRARFYNKFTDRDYVEIVPEFSYEFGMTDLTILYSFIPHKLILDEDTGPNNNLPPTDIFAMRHRLGVELQRKLWRRSKWRVKAMFEGLWVRSTNSVKERDSFTPVGGVELRYRPTRLFVPRVKVQYGERDSFDNNFNRDELDIVVGFDSQLTEGIRWQVRYKRGSRDYTASGPQSLNSNFRRNDDSDQYRTKLEYAVPGVDGLAITAHYRFRKNHSSRVSRNFTIQEGGLGVSYTFR